MISTRDLSPILIETKTVLFSGNVIFQQPVSSCLNIDMTIAGSIAADGSLQQFHL